jgi:ketosteroid isomerase-like protein
MANDRFATIGFDLDSVPPNYVRETMFDTRAEIFIVSSPFASTNGRLCADAIGNKYEPQKSMSGSLGQVRGGPEDAVLAADAAWLKVYAAKDLEKSEAFFDDEGSMLTPNSPIATGKGALTKLIGSAFAIPDYQLAWHANKVGAARSGELGYTSGTYDLSVKDASGKTTSDKGKCLTVWKKEKDGSSKVLLDMFNSDLPHPHSPPAY